ncbi:hypothetical protein [Actinokineospora sp. HUAS TT18]|uniref:hypothetical protein n=1 Tax=Actinokineospora sp. HUAS TT18 TaxID=3447451 RepID=UPI003F51D250
MDEQTVDLLLAVPLNDNSEVQEWYRVLRESRENAATFEDFAPAVQDFPAETDTFLATLAYQDYPDAVDRLLELEPHMPDFYFEQFWARHEPTQPEEPQSDDPFAWLTDDQRAAVVNAWGDQWPEPLAQWLESRWGADWQTHPADHKQAWFADMVLELAALTDSAEPPDAEPPDAQLSNDEAFDVVRDALNEAIAEVPGADELSEEELRAVLAEAQAQLEQESTRG